MIAIHVAGYLGLAALVAGGAGEADRRHGRIAVAILVLPSPATGQASRSTHALAREVEFTLRSTGFDPFVFGTPAAVPPEELAAGANKAGVDLAIGIRTAEEPTGGAGVLTPKPARRPEEISHTGDQAELARRVKRLAVAVRYEESVRLAECLKSAQQRSHEVASESDAYVLENVAAPTVVLVVPRRQQPTILRLLPNAIVRWTDGEPSQE